MISLTRPVRDASPPAIQQPATSHLRMTMNLRPPPLPDTDATADDDVTVLSISQATAATFTDLFIGLAFLCFIQTGSKRVACPVNGEIVGSEGDLLVFPPGSIVTLENRPMLNATYRAEGAYFVPELLDVVFPERPNPSRPAGIQVIRAEPARPHALLGLIKATLAEKDLPAPVRRHRLLEPLIWLRHQGVRLPPQAARQPMLQVRRLIETDLSRPWRIADVAGHFAMSEATLRRWLGTSSPGFASILHKTRLERGLALLQTTSLPISQIALECGFRTQSHFADSFRKRFGIKPSSIRSSGH
jgi:AraC-like DNA-binding protein